MDQSIAASEQPRYIKLNERDNVAIVVNDFGLPEGSRFACGLTLRAFVPQGHKTALVDIEEGAPIRRYGEIIGHAASRIRTGEWVDEARIRMPDAPSLDTLEIATAVPPALPPLEGYTFEGFRNADGSVGTKNILGISTSVQCVAGTMEYAVKRIRAELLPKYPDVDDVVALTHAYGCGVAIAAPDAVVPIRTLQNLALNPNFGGEILVVGLGCEKLAPERLLPEGIGGTIVRMQDEAFDGFGAIVDAIMAQAEARLKILNKRKRETCPAAVAAHRVDGCDGVGFRVDEEASAIGDGGHLAPRAVGNEPRELHRVVLIEPVQHQERMAFEVWHVDVPALGVRCDLSEVIKAVLRGLLGRQHLRPVQLGLRPVRNLEPEDRKGAGEEEHECQPTEDQTKPGVQPIHPLREALLLHDSVSCERASSPTVSVVAYQPRCAALVRLRSLFWCCRWRWAGGSVRTMRLWPVQTFPFVTVRSRLTAWTSSTVSPFGATSA